MIETRRSDKRMRNWQIQFRPRSGAHIIDPRSCYVLVALLVLSGCDHLPGKPDIAKRPIAPNEVVAFQTLFKDNCSGCHGVEGKLGPAPPLNNPLFLALITEDELRQIVTEGRHGTLMPGFSGQSGGTLTDEQIQILVSGLKSTWQDQTLSAEKRPSLQFSQGDARNGAILFADACAGCHGENGQGESAGAINEVAFLSLISDRALRRLIITGRPDLGMPDHADRTGRGDNFQPLSPVQIDDLVSLLGTWRNGTSAKLEKAR